MSDSPPPSGRVARAKPTSLADDRPYTMDAGDETTPLTNPPEGARPSFTLNYRYTRRQYEEHRHSRIRVRKERLPQKPCAVTIPYQSSTEDHRPPEKRASTIAKRAVEKETSIRKVVAESIPPESSAEIHKPEEEETSTMAEMDNRSPEAKLTEWLSKLFEELEARNSARNSTGKLAQVETCPHGGDVVSPETHSSSKGKDSIMVKVDSCLHEEEELPDWMSEMFERLDTEMNDHSICSTEKVAKEEIHPLLEHDISSEIHRSSKGEGSVMFEKLDIEDSGYSTGNLSPVKTQPILEHGSSEIHRSTKWQSSFLTKVDIYSSDAEDEYDEWMLKMMKMGANDDMSYLYKVDQEAKHPVHCDQLDGYDLTDEEVENYPKNMKKFS